MFLATALALVGAICSVSPVRGDNSFFWSEEVGGNVIFHHQTSIDLAGFPAPGGDGGASVIDPSEGAFVFSGSFDVYDMVIPDTITMPFGAGGPAAAGSSTGDQFAISGTVIGVPPSYASRTPIAGSMTFLSTTLAALGVDPAPFTINTTVGDNTIYMFTSPAQFAADLAALRKQIRKLQKKAKKLKKKGKKKKAKKLLKKVKQLKQQLAALG